MDVHVEILHVHVLFLPEFHAIIPAIFIIALLSRKTHEARDIWPILEK